MTDHWTTYLPEAGSIMRRGDEILGKHAQIAANLAEIAKIKRWNARLRQEIKAAERLAETAALEHWTAQEIADAKRTCDVREQEEENKKRKQARRRAKLLQLITENIAHLHSDELEQIVTLHEIEGRAAARSVEGFVRALVRHH